MTSPYNGLGPERWEAKTQKLVTRHPLSTGELAKVVLQSWDDIFRSSLGRKNLAIGKEIFPKPQIMAFLLHELIPLEFENRYKGVWRREKDASEKDLVYIPDDMYSVEIKTSSDPRSIFGNRSYAQKSKSSKKSKSGYYLAVNFSKFTEPSVRPEVTRIRFGWLDHDDWFGQKAATGQQASLSKDAARFKLLDIFPDR